MSTATTRTKPTDPATRPAPAPNATRSLDRPPVSVVILTLNEEVNVADCLASCAWCDDVHVLDSGSEDSTARIARELGATVHVHPFESFGKQRNWAIDNIPLKHEWVFHLDADERFTPELVREIAGLLAADPPPAEAGFHVPSKLMFMGRWLRRAGAYPIYQMRFFHKDRMRFVDHGHGQREAPGRALGTLHSPYLHYAFSKGLTDWFDKHNRYSSLEAVQSLSAAQSGSRGSLFSSDPVARRRAWKDARHMLPFWPTLRWLHLMFVLGAVLEGRPGWTYASLLVMYERMTLLKLGLLRAARRRGAASDTPAAGSPAFETDTPARPSTRVIRDDLRIGTDPPAEPRPVAAAAPTAPRPVPASEPAPASDTAQLPEASPWSLRDKIGRAIWMLAGGPLFSLTPRSMHAVRRSLLRAFGARIGHRVRIDPTVSIEIPWHLDIRDDVQVGERAILYALGQITIGARTVIAPYAHLCAGTHDHTDRRFRLIREPITIGEDCWIGVDAFIGPNTVMHRRAALESRASAYKDLAEGTVYAGNPAKAVGERVLA